jgi:cytoskeletal protein RodZ
MGTLQRDTHNRIRFNPLLIIGVIGLIILAVFLFRMVSHASKENTQEPVSAVEDMSAIEQAQGAAINSDASGVGASGSALNLGTAATTATLNLVLTSDAVVSITDASGNSLINGSQSAGNYDLSGMPPFNVQIDNIDNVSLMLNQQPVALDTYATDKQATFELAP